MKIHSDGVITRMHSSRMRTARSLIVSPYLVISHACPPSNHACPPRSNHACPPGATTHAPCEQPCTPQSNHAPPLEQPCMTPWSNNAHPPGATMHAPSQSNHACLPSPQEQPRTPQEEPCTPPCEQNDKQV